MKDNNLQRFEELAGRDELTAEERGELVKLAKAASKEDRKAYQNDWLPLLDGARFLNEPLATVETVKGLKRLAKLFPDALFRLDLTKKGLDHNQAGKVCRERRSRQVSELIFDGNRLTDRACEWIADSTNFGNLRLLSLQLCEIESQGPAMLAEAEDLGTVTNLDLSHNRLRDDGVEALAQSMSLLHGIESLNLSSAHFGDRGAIALANCETLSGIKRLIISFNEIGDEGAKALAESPHLAGLETLKLHSTEIGREGHTALVNSSQFSSSLRQDLRFGFRYE